MNGLVGNWAQVLTLLPREEEPPVITFAHLYSVVFLFYSFGEQ